ncbi:IS66 family transposase [bacterium]|nr:IS66 family transposase [bacterium]
MRLKRPSTFPIDLSRPLTQEEAQALYRLGEEAVIFALLMLSAKLASPNGGESSSAPNTPSGMIPAYQKKNVHRRRKKPGAKQGHEGNGRSYPEITTTTTHPPLETCPYCGTPLNKPVETRTRAIEHIKESTPEVTEHHIPRSWCPTCRRLVEPAIPDALPGSRFGHRLIALTMWLHFGLGITISQIIEVLTRHLQCVITAGGLVKKWHQVAAIFYAWYEEIGQEVKQSGVLHADETGWRVSGQTFWLWCLTTTRATYSMIHKSRGSPALSSFFTDIFKGTLVTDFWAAYNVVIAAARQACLPHLFRELSKVDDRNPSAEWQEFARAVKRLLKAGIRLAGQRQQLSPEEFAQKRTHIKTQFDTFLERDWLDADAQRLQLRLMRFNEAIFTFLDHPDIPYTNNHAEQEIRPAVIMRKNSQCNRSDLGAETQAVLMSVYRTLRLRGHDPLKTIIEALRTYVIIGLLPPLPPPVLQKCE